MALKYYLDYRDIHQNEWRIEIYSPTYTDTPIPFIGSAPDTLSISWGDNSSDDPHAEHVIPSTATINIYNDGVDLQELQNIINDDYKVRIYRNGDLFWSGYLLSDGIQGQRGGVSYAVKLTATDGLRQLDSTLFFRGDNYGTITVNSVVGNRRCPMNAIRLIFQRSELLDNPLPIRWMCNTKSKQYPNSDALSGLNELDPYGDLGSQGYSAFWWLESILKSQYCWLRQYKGYWYIINYKDLIDNDGTFDGWEIPVSSGDVVAIKYVEDMSELVHTSIAGDGYYMLKKSYSNVTAIYNDSTVKNNVVPNGSFDKVSLGNVMYWYAKDGNAVVSPSTPINGEFTGGSCQVQAVTGNDWLTFGTIPLDTSVLFKNATLGFIFNPVSGYSVNSDGILNPDQVKMRVKFTGYRDGQLTNLYLNENGYWQGFGVIGDGIYISNIAIVGNNVEVSFGGESSRSGQKYQVVFLNNPFGSGVQIFAREYTLFDSKPLIQAIDEIALNTNGVRSGNKIIYAGDRPTIPSASITGTEDTPTDINFIFQNGVKQQDIVQVQFQSRGASSDIKLPDCGALRDAIEAGAGLLSIEFYCKQGTTYRLDDFYFTIQDNHDVYEVTNNGKGSSAEYQLNISSSFSGHMISSYMNSYSTANKSMLWGSGDGKTLTELYGINALNWLNRPNSIFQGSVPKEVTSGFTILDGKKYIPLTTTLNCHNMHTNVLLFEAKTVEDEYTITHKSSADDNK